MFPNESIHRETLENLGPSRSAEKHVRIVFAKEAREGPNAEGKAERLMAATGHLEDMMATCHQPGVAGEVAETSLLRLRNTCIVLAREACEGPNTPDQARRLIAETGHHLKIISFTWYSGETAGKSSSVPAGLEGNWCDHHRRDLSSVFMT